MHDGTIESIKTLGMVLGKTTNQASKAIGTMTTSNLLTQNGGVSSQKVMVVPVDCSEMLPKLDSTAQSATVAGDLPSPHTSFLDDGNAPTSIMEAMDSQRSLTTVASSTPTSPFASGKKHPNDKRSSSIPLVIFWSQQ